VKVRATVLPIDDDDTKESGEFGHGSG